MQQNLREAIQARPALAASNRGADRGGARLQSARCTGTFALPHGPHSLVLGLAPMEVGWIPYKHVYKQPY